MKDLWEEALSFAVKNQISLEDLAYVCDIPFSKFNTYSKKGYDLENDPNALKLKHIIEFSNREAWEYEIEARLYIVKTKMTIEKITDIINKNHLSLNEVIKLYNIPTAALELMCKDFEKRNYKSINGKTKFYFD